jgi:histone acetyltransferase (RNA polymerase elongator complex component)
LSVRISKSPLIIPVFIPNQGCPHQCIYCHQEKITGQSKAQVNASHVKNRLNEAINSPRFALSKEREVAFYGGSFTSLGTNRMTELLEVVKPYLQQGLFSSIRVSTRPDEIDEERLNLMRNFGVSTIELGVQSMDDWVLTLSRRGHSADDTVESVKMIKRYGFKVGVQLMPGLPGDSEEKFFKTVNEVIGLQPDMARLYPAIVIDGTELADWYNHKRYQPLTLEEAVLICSESCIRLESRGIAVIRIGLMSSPSLLKEGQIVAGPWHNAFGFLVRSDMHLKSIKRFLPRHGKVSKIGIRAPRREIPLVRGYKNQGLRLMEKKTGAKIIYVKADDSVADGRIGLDLL